MQRRLVLASAIAVVVTAGFLPGAGVGASAAAVRGAHGIPAGLAQAIHARFGAGAIRSGSAAAFIWQPEFGFSVALSADGTTALVGAGGAHRGKGAAYIFHASDAGSWSSTSTPVASLTSSGGERVQLLGYSVALSADGTTAFVGAPLAGAGGSGAIYVFRVSAEDAWANSSTPTATLTVQYDNIGTALAVSSDGTTAAVGGPYYNGRGGGYIFHVSSETAWASTSTPTAILSNASQSGNDGYAGLHVAISADGMTALVSDDQNPSGGGAYLFHVASEASWTTTSTPTAILTDASSSAYDYLGYSVALSGDGTVALLGAPGADSADVFHALVAWASTSIPTATLTHAGGPAHAVFGFKVGLSTDGSTALVTAADNGARGSAYIFHVADEAAWVSSSAPTAALTNSAGHTGDALGIGVAFSADAATTLLGAPGVRYETGAADVFHVSDASSWASSSTPAAILTNSALNACVVPRLKGKTVTAAKAALRARSCRLGRVRRVHHAGTRHGRVFFQSIKPGMRPAVGTKVAVKVAR